MLLCSSVSDTQYATVVIKELEYNIALTEQSPSAKANAALAIGAAFRYLPENILKLHHAALIHMIQTLAND